MEKSHRVKNKSEFRELLDLIIELKAEISELKIKIKTLENKPAPFYPYYQPFYPQWDYYPIYPKYPVYPITYSVDTNLPNNDIKFTAYNQPSFHHQ